MSVLRNCCCCCAERDDEVELKVSETKGGATKGNAEEHFSSHSSFPDSQDVIGNDDQRTEEESTQVREEIKLMVKAFWQEALNGIAATRLVAHKTPQPVIFRLSTNMDFSVSQTSIYPDPATPVIEIHSLSNVRVVKRGAPGLPSQQARHAISIWLHEPQTPMIALLLANRSEQERFYVSLSIFAVIGGRLCNPRAILDIPTREFGNPFSDTSSHCDEDTFGGAPSPTATLQMITPRKRLYSRDGGTPSSTVAITE